jgi:hypothetical protein
LNFRREVVVGPAAVAHVADLNLHVVVDLGAAFVLSTLRLLLLLIVIEETIDLRLTHAVKAVSDRFLALLMLLNSLLYDFVRVDSYINVIKIGFFHLILGGYVVLGVVHLRVGLVQLFALLLKFLFQILLLLGGQTLIHRVRLRGLVLLLGLGSQAETR